MRHCTWTADGGKGERRSPELEGSSAGKDFDAFRRGIGRKQDGLQNDLGNGFRGHHFAARSLRPERVPDIGIGGSGKQSDDANTAGAKFFAESVGEPEGSVLGSVVGGGAREDAVGRDGEIVHDSATALHDRESRLGDKEHSVEIGFENIFPERKGELLDRKIGVRDAGVVDENVETWELAASSAEECVDGVRIADVAGMSQHANFLTGEFPAETLECGLIAGGQNHVAAFRGEGASDGEADAAGGAGDKGNLTAEALGLGGAG